LAPGVDIIGRGPTPARGSRRCGGRSRPLARLDVPGSLERDMIGRPNRLLLAALLLAGAGCQTSDDARVLQVLNQRGFGRATQDANRQYYIGIQDSITLRDPGHQEYNNITEVVRMDGVVTLPEAGEVYLNGLSPAEATEAVRLAYSAYLNDTSSMVVDVTTIASKRYYVSGLAPRKPSSITFKGDELLVDVLIKANLDSVLVDETEILVIRGDPENPLVIRCNYDAIIQDGLTRDNIQIRENDIVYLTPSIIGYITAAVAALAAPLKPIAALFQSANNVVSLSDSFGQNTYGYGGYGNYGNNNNYNNPNF
jgi:protein involved in polysaccharide export with SLBB domain